MIDLIRQHVEALQELGFYETIGFLDIDIATNLLVAKHDVLDHYLVPSSCLEIGQSYIPPTPLGEVMAETVRTVRTSIVFEKALGAKFVFNELICSRAIENAVSAAKQLDLPEEVVDSLNMTEVVDELIKFYENNPELLRLEAVLNIE
jgi:hypothetical protein